MRLLATLILISLASQSFAGENIFSVEGNRTYLNNKEFLCIGLRCSNALISEESSLGLIGSLDLYKSYGINTVSVFIMGSRFGDIKGYRADGSLDPVYSERLARIIEACDSRDMVVLIGCLYWGGSKAKWENWTQVEANSAIRNTISWLSDNDYRNVFVDPDNEAMARREQGINVREMISVAKATDPSIIIGYNVKTPPPENADLGLHFAIRTTEKPYIESEGTPPEYWGEYSKEKGLYEYINVGIYTKGKKTKQIKDTDDHLESGAGYMMASTWLQNVPPNYHPGGDGSPKNPGILWWLEHIKANYYNSDIND